VIAERDVILQHPYESYDPVVEFVSARRTTARAGRSSRRCTARVGTAVRARVARARRTAAVTRSWSIKARFREENNIQWARALEEAGVHVEYAHRAQDPREGVPGGAPRVGRPAAVRALLPGTQPRHGEAVPRTSRSSRRPELGEARSDLCSTCSPLTPRRVVEAALRGALGLHERVLALIHREPNTPARTRRASSRRMNSLVDPGRGSTPSYLASQAGVQVEP